MVENQYNDETTNTIGNIESVKNISDALKKVNGSVEEINDEGNSTYNSQFKVASTNLPEKTGFWTKVKNALFYEIKVELTPYQQKIEDEINEFLHKEITWKSVKEAAFSEVHIKFRGKRIF